MEREIFIRKYLEALQNDRAAVFAGAGLSKGSGIVDWAGLLKDIGLELGITVNDGTDLVDLAQYYENEMGNHTELANLIFNSVSADVDPNANHVDLARLPIKEYWTTNYDKLIEKALANAGKTVDAKFEPDSLALSKDNRDVIVYKMNGDIDHPSTAILTRNQFEDYEDTHVAFINALRYALANYTFLFIGLSFDDPSLKYILSYIRRLFGRNQRTHYYILRKVQLGSLSTEEYSEKLRAQQLFVDDLKRYNIQTVMIDDFSEITDILDEIRNRFFHHKVFISGAAVKYDPFEEHKFKDFVKELSSTLVSKGYTIINGYGLGLGNEVLVGATRAAEKLNKPIGNYIEMHPFPQGFKDPRAMWKKYREEMISKTGISIFLVGNKLDKITHKLILSNGMQEEFDISLNHGNLLIPIGSTGFMSKELWYKWNNTLSSDKLYNNVRDEIKSLGAEHTLEEILQILESIFTKLQ